MNYILAFISALACSALLTPLVRFAAIKAGAVVAPRKDRWHTQATPVLGGAAIFLSYAIVHLAALGFSKDYLPLLVCGAMIFLLGLYDDLRGVSPQVKFVCQIGIAALLVSTGTVVKIIPWPVVAYPLTFLWIVGLTNAFNLIDNIDGLSAGIAAISSLAICLFSLPFAEDAVAVLSIALAGACLGFLFYNFNPARIFMGDCGSMFLGFTLASLSLSGTWRHASSLFVTLLAPILILGIPIFDTAFVTITRKLRGQPVSQGGKDHLSHRLVFLGFSEKKTVMILYSISGFFALGALFFNKINPAAFAAVAVVFCVALFYFCVYLGYSGYAGAKKGAGVKKPGYGRQVRALLINGQRFMEIFIDLALIVASYFLAYLIRFETGLPELQVSCFAKTLPVLIFVKVVVFYYFGLYQTIWRHVGVRDFINILKAIFTSSLIVVFVIFMYARLEYFSRTVFIIDAMLCLLLVSGAHFAFRILREYLEGEPRSGRRVVLIGAGDAGEMALREIRNNPGLKFQVAGFLDDDPFKQKRRIHDVRVLGKIEDIGTIAKRTGAREALIAIPSLTAEGFERIVDQCRRHGVECRRFGE